MKRILIIVALAAVVASPAMAKSHHNRSLSHARAQIERQVPENAYGAVPGGGGTYEGYPLSQWYSQRDGW
jgi:hypothetical protein